MDSKPLEIMKHIKNNFTFQITYLVNIQIKYYDNCLIIFTKSIQIRIHIRNQMKIQMKIQKKMKLIASRRQKIG